MIHRVLAFTTLLICAALSVGCETTQSDGGQECPSVEVAIDGGLDASTSEAGASAPPCLWVCPPSYGRCEVINETKVKCWKGCM